MQNRFFIIAAILLCGLMTGNTFAANDPMKEGGIGGTGSAANNKGIGGTGTPMNGGIGGTGMPMNGGIGGTGAQPKDESVKAILAGKVLFIVGQVEAQNSGQVRSLAKGDSVRVGDTLSSAKGATLQLRMEDGGTIVLRPDSQLSIENFVYSGVQDGNERLALALLRGGFRAVTGEIGHLHKENYSIHTPNAEVGILGTDHETVFVPADQQGQIAGVEPGTYNHVISGATILHSQQGKLRIQPNQTGYAGLSGASPAIIGTPLPIFGDPKVGSGGEHHGDSATGSTSGSGQNSKSSTGSGSGTANDQGSNVTSSDSGQNPKGTGNASPAANSGQNSNSSDQNSGGSPANTGQSSNSSPPGSGQSQNNSTSGADQNTRGAINSGPTSNIGQNLSDPTQNTQQNKVTQPNQLANTTLDLNTLETDASPASSGSGVVGAHLTNGLLAVGSAQVGNSGETLLTEDDVPGYYSNKTTGFNFISNESGPNVSGTATVDGASVTWGLYSDGTSFDPFGKPITVNYHPFAYVMAGVTPQSTIGTLSGNAPYTNMVGSTTVTESGVTGGTVTLNVGINFGGTPSVSSYNLAVTDGNSRNWTGTLNGQVPLSAFANGVPLAVTCSCPGTPSGNAAGLLIGSNASGLISSYVMSTNKGAAVAGAVVISR